MTVSGRLDLDTSTLYMDADAASRPTQRGVSGFAAARLPPVELRAASDLQLVAKSNGGVSTFAEVGNMLVFASARIVAAPGSTMAFATSGNLDFNGSILSPAGTIKLSVQSPAFAHDQGFIQGQHLRLGSTATIDVGGIAVLQPNDAGLLRGTVLNGGSVSLTAQRGSVVTLPGSHIDISGTQAQLDLPVTQPAAGWQRSTIASSAGSLSVTAVESASLLGSIEAHGGQGSTGFAAGGSLQVSLSKQTSGFSVRNGTESSYPTAPRTIRLSAGCTNPGGRQHGSRDSQSTAARQQRLRFAGPDCRRPDRACAGCRRCDGAATGAAVAGAGNHGIRFEPAQCAVHRARVRIDAVARWRGRRPALASCRCRPMRWI